MPQSIAKPVSLYRGYLRFGRACRISFQRTLRVPLQGSGIGDGAWPLPPSLGSFPIFRVKQFAGRLPSAWRAPNAFFLPLYQREALWIAFDGAPDSLCAVQIGAGGVNVISGEPFADGLTARPQNYIVVPDQPWLDGINSGNNTSNISGGSDIGGAIVRQFVAMPLGSGVTIEAQIGGTEQVGGLQLRVYPAKPGVTPRVPLQSKSFQGNAMNAPVSMGLAAGGEIRQKIYPDAYGIEAWDAANRVEAFVHLLNSSQFRHVTGLKPPPTPIKAQTYTKYGFPWFALYDEHWPSLSGADKLSKVRPAGEMQGWNEESLTIDPRQIRLGQSKPPKS
jgi:hypothetical protein